MSISGYRVDTWDDAPRPDESARVELGGLRAGLVVGLVVVGLLTAWMLAAHGGI